MNRIIYILFLFFIHAFSIMPFRLIFAFSDLLYYFFYYVYRYRRRVVASNLSLAFPEKSREEIVRISKAFYRHFCDIVVEGVKAFSMTPAQAKSRYKILNPEILDSHFEKKQSVIVVYGHFNNWEWGSLAGRLQLKHKPVAFYKPLSNKLIDDYIRRIRAKTGTELVSIVHTATSFSAYKNEPAIFVMVADQSPSKLSHAIWVKFMNQDTPTLHGPEKYAVRFGIPVYYGKVIKIKRGVYNAVLEPLLMDPASSSPGEITQLFMGSLEKQIREKPEYWLWSHRRWKHNR
jgi:Kdo2-lipid IVA lauroyltransferase/acyltransferase